MRAAAFGALALLLFGLPYFHPPGWSFALSSALLVGLFLLRFGRAGIARLGLAVGPGAAGLSLLVFAATAAGAVALHAWVATRAGLEALAPPLLERLDVTFQALNEEMLLGFALLAWALRRTGRAHAVVLALALGFALLHQLFYRFVSDFGVGLGAEALLGVALFGLARAYLILATGHVGLAWGLHAGWNVVFLGMLWIRTGRDPGVLTEPELFDRFLGQPVTLLAAGLVAALAGAWVARRGVHARFASGAQLSRRPPSAPPPR